MNYTSEFKKFVSSQHMYSAIRITLSCVIPSLILAHFGILKEYFLFPLGTSFVALTDLPGPFIRRRNSFIFAIICFAFVALISSLVSSYWVLVILVIIFFSLFLAMIGIYGQRLGAVGSLALVVMAIFIDGHLVGNDLLKNMLIFVAGCTWFLIVFLVVSTLQPYKLAGQMIGENYLKLADLLRIKADFYQKNPDFDKLFKQVIGIQVGIKNLQEETRETVFKTRKIVNESTTTSRILVLMFLNSIDLHEKLMTSESDYEKLQNSFKNENILNQINTYLHVLAEEITNIGIALQSNSKTIPNSDLKIELQQLNDNYFELRNQKLTPENLENFLILRKILLRINEITKEVQEIFNVFGSDEKLAKSLSTGLDFANFVPKQEKLNLKILKTNISLSSAHFRHTIRIALALLIGYFVGQISFLGIGHTYWILITLVAILRPAYSTTKHRNLLRLYGTIAGAVLAYGILMFIPSNFVLLTILLLSMVLCFSFLKERYFWAVFFMTIYIFLTFNFLNPGNVNVIFKDRIIDTALAGLIAFLVSYTILPVWEHTQNIELMRKSALSNLNYFSSVMEKYFNKAIDINQYKLRRKNAIIDLANLSDSFQKMLSEPKNQQKKMEVVHQFVATSHLITAYTASLSQYFNSKEDYPEIDAESWNKKIIAELATINTLLKQENIQENIFEQSKIEPDDHVDDLLMQRKSEIQESDIIDRRNPNQITYLTQLKNIQDILELIYDVAKEQRKVIQNYYKETKAQQS